MVPSPPARRSSDNQYVQRLIEDEELRDNLRTAFESARKAYARIANGKGPAGAHRGQEDPEGAQGGGQLAAGRGRLPAQGARRSARSGAASLLMMLRRRRRRRARAQRGSAQEGARRAVRGRGGVRVHLDHHASDQRPAQRAGRDCLTGLAERAAALEGAPSGAPSSFLAGQPAGPRVEASVDTPAQAGRREGAAHRRGDAPSVAARGAAGSTFDIVAREAGVSRGLLHYYFGSKERLLVEVVRHDCDDADRGARGAAGAAPVAGRDRRVAGRSTLKHFVADDPGTPGGGLRDAQRLAPQRGDPRRAGRAVPHAGATHLADVAAQAKEQEGVVELAADAEAVASVIFALGDGLGMQLMSDPEWDSAPALELGVADRAPPARR